jgi:NAD+ synthase (glutamine-hydrolysing)
MRLVSVALASIKTNVGAVLDNVAHVTEMARQMSAANVTLAVFPEQVIGGYPPEDLVQWRGFVEAQTEGLRRFAKATADSRTAFVLGMVVANEGHRHNVAAVVHHGQVIAAVPKEKLPTYNVFYEQRTFSAGIPFSQQSLWGGVPLGDYLVRFDWGVLGVEVCEDLWSPDGPMRRRVYSGAEIIANVSASPYRLGVVATRREMIATRSGDNQCAIAYANAVGAQDGLVFDGGGWVCQNGRMLLEARRFREGWEQTTIDLDRTSRLRAENTTWRADALAYAASGQRVTTLVADGPGADRSALKYPAPPHASFFLPSTAPPVDARTEFCEDLLDALALGVGDYFEKNRFKQIGIALSGGRDSLLTLLVAWRYAGARAQELIRCFYMPSRYSSSQTSKAAEQICADLGVPFAVVSIEEAFQRELEATEKMLGPGEKITPVTLQNIQARVRGARMWNWSNSTGGLFLQTGNMSEKSVGYTTIGGDLEGALSVISNVPKTVVIYLLEYLQGKHGFPGIDAVFVQPAGPELAEAQVGEKELMPFRILDACLALYGAEKLDPGEMGLALESCFPDVPAKDLHAHAQRFVKLFSQSIYKWVQAPLGLHVGNLDLERERALQLPVVSANQWMDTAMGGQDPSAH